MAVLSRLLKVGSMTASLGVYVPATVFRQMLGLGRVYLFMYLLGKTGYGMWGLGVMIFTMASSLLTLGSHHGLVRYVSFYEARGQILDFYRRMRWRILACAAVLTVAALALTRGDVLILLTHSRTSSAFDYHQQMSICYIAIANAGLLALYHNMLGFLIGMRLYRAVSALEIAFAVLFAAGGAIAALTSPVAMSLLIAHLAALGVVFVVGLFLLQAALTRLPTTPDHEVRPQEDKESLIPEPDGEVVGLDAAMPLPVRKAETTEPEGLEGCFARVIRFGFVATMAGFIWQGAGYISFLLTSRRYGHADAGVFFAFLPLGQSMMALANAARAVIFTHVAKHWESGDKRLGLFLLETAYKTLTIGTMTMAVLLYVTSPWWVKILPADYRIGLCLLGGLLLFFQASIHLALLNTLARLHERPVVIAIGPLIGGVIIVPLALWWMDKFGPEGAALAAGVGMYVGMMVVSLGYFLATHTKMHASTYFTMAVPAVLLLPQLWMLGLVWIMVLIVSISTTWIASARQKRILSSSIRRVFKRVVFARQRSGNGKA